LSWATGFTLRVRFSIRD